MLAATQHLSHNALRLVIARAERERIPIPEPNTRVGRYRPDMLWRDAMLIVELDGGPAHHSPAQLAADADCQRWLEDRGYRVLRFTHEEVEREPGRVAALVRTHLA
jgi:very-short-patch-repair endonuclease